VRGWKTVGRLPGKVAGSLRLLRRDPEALARNLLQFTNPTLFERRLIDVMHAVPMHVRFDPALVGPPRLNILDSAWTTSGMTGGPNTVINLAVRIAREGIAVRLVSTVQPNRIDPVWFQRHAVALTGDDRRVEVTLASAAQADRPLELGPGDGFLATHWTTAQQLQEVLPLLPIRQFFYMLQEFEPGFYPWSSNYARAVETYGMDFWPIVNEAMLAEFLFSQPFGRLAEPVIRSRAVVFEPAVDASLFYPPSAGAPARPRRLLFYARPTNTRNMFGIGLMALRRIAAAAEFAGWEFLSIGSPGGVPDLSLGHGHMLRQAPWMDYAGYGELLRHADLLLCPMLSPHTSYPVLEMAACGGLSITNCFSTKTKDNLTALSHNIIAVDPTIAGFAEGLLRGARAVTGGAPRVASLNMARDWGAALDPVAGRIAEIFRGLQPGAQADGRSQAGGSPPH
jgi:WsaF, C-terminal domain/WsaF, N-terminal domain